jgi:hypothetical protein
MAQKSMLEEEAEKLGIDVIFLPKFHCELNYIGMARIVGVSLTMSEYLWGYAKQITRAQSDGTKKTLDTIVPRALKSCPLETIRRMDVEVVDLYAQGLDGRLAAFALKKYRGHRMIPKFLPDMLDELTAELDANC